MTLRFNRDNIKPEVKKGGKQVRKNRKKGTKKEEIRLFDRKNELKDLRREQAFIRNKTGEEK